jgi:hypothetical protein
MINYGGKKQKRSREYVMKIYLLHSHTRFKWIDTVINYDYTGYLNQKTVNLKNKHILVKHTLTVQFLKKWHDPVLQSAKCSNYKKII